MCLIPTLCAQVYSGRACRWLGIENSLTPPPGINKQAPDPYSKVHFHGGLVHDLSTERVVVNQQMFVGMVDTLPSTHMLVLVVGSACRTPITVRSMNFLRHNLCSVFDWCFKSQLKEGSHHSSSTKLQCARKNCRHDFKSTPPSLHLSGSAFLRMYDAKNGPCSSAVEDPHDLYHNNDIPVSMKLECFIRHMRHRP